MKLKRLWSRSACQFRQGLDMPDIGVNLPGQRERRVMSVKKGIAVSLLALAMGAAAAATAHGADWELTENGKNWMYMYAPDDPAKDEWIEDNGKTYYLDSKGYMKTGWVSNKDDGQKYYMGPDGAMAFNMVAPDGKYVGPEGTGLPGYDKYRKAVRSELKKAVPKKSTAKKNGKTVQNETQSQVFFTMYDLNMDGYRDLVIMRGNQEAESLYEVAVWVPEDGKFQLAAEFDTSEGGQRGTLYLDPEGEEVWLELTESSGDMRLFQMRNGSGAFRNSWTFTLENDEDGYPQYYVNGDPEDRQSWELFLEQARRKRGNTPLTGYVLATDENIAALVDVILTEQEIDMWR